MKKPAFLLTAAFVGLTFSQVPVQPQAAKVSVIQIGTSSEDCNANAEAVKEYLANCQLGGNQIITIPSFCENLKDYICGIELPGCEAGDSNDNTSEDTTETPDNDNTGDIIDTPDNDNTGDIIDTPDNGNTEDTTGTPDNENTEDTASDYHAYVLRVVELVNEARAEAGLNPVTLAADVTAAAQVRAKETVTNFSHTRPNGTGCFTALDEAGVSYHGAGENIAWGQKTPEEVMNGWMNSAGHRANILNGKFTTIGVGYHQSASGVNYWTQMFTY